MKSLALLITTALATLSAATTFQTHVGGRWLDDSALERTELTQQALLGLEASMDWPISHPGERRAWSIGPAVGIAWGKDQEERGRYRVNETTAGVKLWHINKETQGALTLELGGSWHYAKGTATGYGTASDNAIGWYGQVGMLWLMESGATVGVNVRYSHAGDVEPYEGGPEARPSGLSVMFSCGWRFGG